MNPTEVAIAVLPLENLSEGKLLDVLCKSFTIDLITELSRFRQFQIISFASVKDLASDNSNESSLLAELQTDYFVKGSFRTHSDMIRINAQLVSSHTHRIIWADRFEGNTDEVLEIQENILTEVVSSLQAQLNYNLLAGIRKKPKTNLKAYECWVYGLNELKKGTIESDLKAREFFQQAIEMDPDYSLAYSGLSLSYFNEWSCQLWDRWDLCKNGSFDMAQKAIELDEQNYVAAFVLGRVFTYRKAYSSAEYYLRKSLQLNSNDPDALIQIAMCFIYLGYLDEAWSLYEKTLRLNPRSGKDHYSPVGAFILIEKGEYKRAIELAGDVEDPPYIDAPAYYAAAHFHLGDYEQMHICWNKFLSSYAEKINLGMPANSEAAIQWMMDINPYRYLSKVDDLWRYMTNDKLRMDFSADPKSNSETSYQYILQKNQDVWECEFEGKRCQLMEVKGFFDLQKLLSHPNNAFHSAELMGINIQGRGEPVFDEKAKRTYQNRILDLQKEIEEADTHNDYGKLYTLQEEYGQLIEHLSNSLDIRGNTRVKGNNVEKARSAVTWRIRHAISKIEEAHPQMGKHLSNSVKTGVFCSYEPEKELVWTV